MHSISYKLIATLTLLLISALSLAEEDPSLLNKDNFSQYFEALESRDYDALRNFYAEDITIKLAEDVLDREGVIEFEKQQAQFVDIAMDIRRIIGDDSAIAVEAIQTQTMTQSPPGSSLKIGDQFRIHMIIFYTLNKGKISQLEVLNLSSEQL